jgi:quinohemoprotein ethanol dehydrogenase
MRKWQVLGLTALCLALPLTIAVRSSADNQTKAGNVSEARAISDATEGDNWLLNGRTFDEQHFSPLKEVTDKNVSGLGLAWFLDIDSGMGIVSEP